MRPVVAFVAGALLGGAAVALVTRVARPPSDARAGNAWRARAERAERELAEARRRMEALATRLQDSADRLDALAADVERRGEPAAPSSEVPEKEAAEVGGPESSPTPEFQPVPEEQWDALVRGALESEVERRLGTTLPPERIERLMDSLRRVRETSRALDEEGAGAEEPESARRELTRNVIVLQADRAFREELGIGIADFLRGLEPEQVEEIPR